MRHAARAPLGVRRMCRAHHCSRAKAKSGGRRGAGDRGLRKRPGHRHVRSITPCVLRSFRLLTRAMCAQLWQRLCSVARCVGLGLRLEPQPPERESGERAARRRLMLAGCHAVRTAHSLRSVACVSHRPAGLGCTWACSSPPFAGTRRTITCTASTSCTTAPQKAGMAYQARLRAASSVRCGIQFRACSTRCVLPLLEPRTNALLTRCSRLCTDARPAAPAHHAHFAGCVRGAWCALAPTLSVRTA